MIFVPSEDDESLADQIYATHFSFFGFEFPFLILPGNADVAMFVRDSGKNIH